MCQTSQSGCRFFLSVATDLNALEHNWGERRRGSGNRFRSTEPRLNLIVQKVPILDTLLDMFNSFYSDMCML